MHHFCLQDSLKKQYLDQSNILCEKQEEIAAKLKYDKVWLGVMKDNLKALDWYQKIEFQFVEEEPFKMGETEILHLTDYKIIPGYTN